MHFKLITSLEKGLKTSFQLLRSYVSKSNLKESFTSCTGMSLIFKISVTKLQWNSNSSLLQCMWIMTHFPFKWVMPEVLVFMHGIKSLEKPVLQIASWLKGCFLCWVFLEVQVEDFQCHTALKNMTALQSGGQRKFSLLLISEPHHHYT